MSFTNRTELFSQIDQTVGRTCSISQDEATAKYAPNLLGRRCRIRGAVKTRSTKEVQAVIQVAREWDVPLYTVSTGRNWGYGTSSPVQEGCLILDLSQHKMIEVDEASDTVCVGPGVTQGDLYAHFSKHSIPYMVPTTGAGPECSLLGNALERGYGLVPINDHFSAVRGISAVLPDGSLYRSPLLELGGAPHQWGVGAYLDGLFSQSNFGIVTSMKIAVARTRSKTAAFQVLGDDVRAVSEVMRVLSVKLNGTMAAMQLLNASRMLAMQIPYPSDSELLSQQTIDRTAAQHRVSPWTGFGVLSGEPGLVSAARRIVSRETRARGLRTRAVSEKTVRIASSLSHWLPKTLREKTRLTTNALGLAMGKPSPFARRMIAWRPGGKYPNCDSSPTTTNNGLIWYAPLIKFESQSIEDFERFVSSGCRKFGFNPLITLSRLSQQCLDATIPILFDRSDASATQRARECYDHLLTEGIRNGFVPYRLPVSHMNHPLFSSLSATTLADRIRTSLSDSNLLSPGRYAGSSACRMKAVS